MAARRRHLLTWPQPTPPVRQDVTQLVATVFKPRTDGSFYCAARTPGGDVQAYVQFREPTVIVPETFQWQYVRPLVCAGNVTQLVALQKDRLALSNMVEGPHTFSLPSTDDGLVRMALVASISHACSSCHRCHAAPCCICHAPSCHAVPTWFCAGCGQTACGRCSMQTHVCKPQPTIDPAEANVYCKASGKMQPRHVLATFAHVASEPAATSCGHLAGHTAQAAVRRARTMLQVPGDFVTYYNERIDAWGAVARGISRTIMPMPTAKQAALLGQSTDAGWRSIRKVLALQKCLGPLGLRQLDEDKQQLTYCRELSCADIAFARSVAHLYTAAATTIDMHGFLRHLCEPLLPDGAATIVINYTTVANCTVRVAQAAAAALHEFASYDGRNVRSFCIAEVLWNTLE